ncbi:MAG: cytochrome c biogenesis protein CcdA, partial [Candidatus Gracilibacteria bacterium]
LPTYLASVFKEKKNILRMTLVFFAGISVVLIPIGLGAASLARVFQDFHQQMYIIGGTLMLVLAVMSVLGKGLAMVPMGKFTMPEINVRSAKSVFLLGIFSGAATSCCAPVLAGAVTLAVISGTFWKALIVTFAYVFGMVFPLFVTAYFYDRFHLDQSRLIKGKLMEWKIGAKTIYVHTTNLLAGILFFLIGVTLLYLALSENEFFAPSYQAKISDGLNQWSQSFLTKLGELPDIIWAILVLGVFGIFLYKAIKNRPHQ